MKLGTGNDKSNKTITTNYENTAFGNAAVGRDAGKCSKDNLRSANSIKSSGFHLDGIARQSAVYPDGKLYDNMMWSKLRSEYMNK